MRVGFPSKSFLSELQPDQDHFNSSLPETKYPR